jgi:hypothetical protein
VGWQAFIASLVRSLAWPAAVLVVGIVLRKPIGAVLGQGVRRVKAGPVEVEFDLLQAEVREELARSPELTEAPAEDQASAPPTSLGEELSRLAEISPASAVMEASKRIEYRLAEMLDGAGVPPGRMGIGGLARLAKEHGLISDQTLAAIEGMSVLRNLTAHSRGGDIGVDRAREYLALADAVLYALRSKPSS